MLHNFVGPIACQWNSILLIVSMKNTLCGIISFVYFLIGLINETNLYMPFFFIDQMNEIMYVLSWACVSLEIPSLIKKTKKQLVA